MVKKLRNDGRANAARTKKARNRPEVNTEKEQILRAATIHLIMKHGGLLVATALREERDGGARRWVITVTLRYPTGHEGYVGDLLYDGKEFTFLTPAGVIDERVRQIGEDPERMRKWNEYRSSALPAGDG